jgi:hypothetical protein
VVLVFCSALDLTRRRWQGGATADTVFKRFLEEDMRQTALPQLAGDHSTRTGVALGKHVVLQVRHARADRHSLIIIYTHTHTQRLHLQIDTLVDVKESAHSQLEKIRSETGRSASNHHRMLKLRLTDGHQTVVGMEYSRIADLSLATKPGVKVRRRRKRRRREKLNRGIDSLLTVPAQIELKPDTMIQRGVLLLTPAVVRVLGGGVDAMLAQFNQRNVLERLLG